MDGKSVCINDVKRIVDFLKHSEVCGKFVFKTANLDLKQRDVGQRQYGLVKIKAMDTFPDENRTVDTFLNGN